MIKQNHYKFETYNIKKNSRIIASLIKVQMYSWIFVILLKLYIGTCIFLCEILSIFF